MKTCVLNYARVGREPYEAGQERLWTSLIITGYEGPTHFRRLVPNGCPSHDKVPYAFKAFMFQEAFDLGFDLVLWLDASVVVRKSLAGVWCQIQKTPFFVENVGCSMAAWAGEAQLCALGVSLERAVDMPMCRSGVIGLNSNRAVDRRIVEDAVAKACRPGAPAYNGKDESRSPHFVAHRHDQVVFTALLHKYGIRMLPRTWACYSDESVVDDAVFEFRGMGGLWHVQSER